MTTESNRSEIFPYILIIFFTLVPVITCSLVVYQTFWQPRNNQEATAAVVALKSEFEPGGYLSRSLSEQFSQHAKIFLSDFRKSAELNNKVNSDGGKETQIKLDRVIFEMKDTTKHITDRLDEQKEWLRSVSKGATDPAKANNGKRSLVAISLSKSLNLSKDETRDLLNKLVASLPTPPDDEKQAQTNKLLVANDISSGKYMLLGKENFKSVDGWLVANPSTESRPALDGLPQIVSDSLGSAVKLFGQLIVVTNHEFRFRGNEFADWNQFKSVIFVMLEGPIPDYFEWGHFNKLKEFRKKWQNNETKVRIFKRQLDKGMVLEEMVDLANMVAELAKN